MVQFYKEYDQSLTQIKDSEITKLPVSQFEAFNLSLPIKHLGLDP